MAAEAQPQIVVEVADQPPSPRRPSRALKPSAKAREAMQSLEDVATTSRRAASEYHAGGYDARSTRVWDSIWSQQPDRDGEVRYTDAPGGDQRTTRRNVPNDYRAAKHDWRTTRDTRTQLSEELRQARDQIDTLQRNPVAMASSQPSARGSYAEVARTPPSSQAKRVEEKEKGNVQVADIRKAIETEARAQESMGDWRCAAVVKEARNPDRVRVICRDEGEVQLVKEAAEKISVPGVRVLRDQLYPVRVDNANRTAVLDADGNILPGAAEALGTENDVNIAKIAWLSRKDTSKAYGSMVVYVTKGSEARRLLDGRYFHLVGESAYTTVFAPREGPIQCYRCQEIGHKAFACKKPQRCGRCAEQGHHHKTCQSVVLKCVLCRGPHESFSKNCRRFEPDSSAVGRPHRSTHPAPRSGSADGVSQTNYSDARFTSCDHGSDHRAIETAFDTSVEDRPSETRFLFKNAPWAEIRTRVAANLERIPWDGNVQQQTDRLMAAVTEAVYGLTPKAKPSPYAKRWWTTDLTRLRQTYTFWRNQARSRRRIGQTAPELEQRARMAAKEYHDAIRRQKSSHWNDFLADDANIWQATKYLQTGSGTMGDKIPPLVRPDGSITEGKAEQAQELLTAFFPPLPARIEDEGQRPQRAPVHMPDLTMEEIEQKVLSAKPWKAPGEDGLPAMVWRQLWPVVKDRVLHLFRTSLRDGDIPSQWRNAKIIPLKKPGKSEYTLAKSWRPISLLSTLGKILEAVIAERLSHAVETCGLLPANHFGARKRRSTEQALLLLQEHIYKAWRARKVLSLISFDVKGAYNGVFKDRLLQRLKARGIPEPLVKWIDAFCSKRTATIAVNGFTSGRQELPQAGLPQGSPLSPVLFLFFNADLVQHKIDANGGAIAFVDDYTAWVTGPSAESNRTGIQAIIDKALDWEKRSGAQFEGEKTAIIHFTRNMERFSEQPFSVKGEVVKPKESAKILGVVMDRELRYKQHIARTAAKGLAAALALKRLKMLSPRTARQLFVATVAPVMDYAANVWMHACGEKALSWLNRAQKIGALAITGAFRTAATAVVEAEASIYPVRERHAQAAASLWINIHTLPGTHPLAMKKVRTTVRFVSPLQKIARVAEGVRVDRMETIQEYAVPPWVPRLRPTLEADRGKAAEMVNKISGIVIATSSSVKKGIVWHGRPCTGYSLQHELARL
ncbi:hypothetical protein CHGG_08348 [Chaetomium globosum CBS 148.51]|uniref:Reverse transcriptase domain-containing protein n=1 Tax=Chaetomium globosum (strain ATCC 6205 / CBS 148.51 / DSM 1962 / NBRC 6347 / NRRL 1970) TaxID=306901 RepID=Q2GUK6_CHAGB|nr:uncharacterized protein CHGG_08348 [Chaetomium globosum CBS 148.51]EAQ84334.1 hypothetical protein CHGG_08348 [Chaetomium globosum CBS 148.51]